MPVRFVVRPIIARLIVSLGLPAMVFAPVVIAQPAFAQAPPAQTAPVLRRLDIVTAAGPQTFEVEIATNDADRAQGLMYRRSMAPNHGMLFDFARAEPISMWMKNTYLSLDMIFIRTDGTIAGIAESTEPLSTRIISSGEPVLGVLEVVGGTARRLGIKPGDRVDYPLFRKS